MMGHTVDARWTAALPVVLVFVLGAVAGVAADRLWINGGVAELGAATLTTEGMAGALDLDPSQRERVAALLDTLQPFLAQAAVGGPDSLQAAARMARQRLEEALPPDRRLRFRSWMDDQHSRMREDMRSGNMMGWTPMMEPDMIRRWTPDRRAVWDRWMEDDCGSCRQ